MTAESKAEHTNRLYRRLAAAQRQCDDATELLNAERLRSADLRAALRRIVAAQRQCDDATELLNAERLRSADLRAALRAIADLDGEAHGPAGAFAAAVRIAEDALTEGRLG